MVGILLAGQIEKGQEMITKYMLQSLYDLFDDAVILTTMKYKLNKFVDAKIIRIPILEESNVDAFFEDCTDLIKKNNLDTIIVVKHTMLDDCKRGNQGGYDRTSDNIINYYLKNENIRYKLNYRTKLAIINKMVFIKFAMLKHLKVIHYCFDPFEPIIQCKKRVGLLSDDITDYIPCYESAMIKDGFSLAKENDLLFYCSAMTDDRKWIADKKQGLEDDNNFRCKTDIKILTRETKSKKEVKQANYYKLLAASRYTLIIPSYDIKSFSIIRFIEAVSHCCLPFVLDRCNINALANDFPDFKKIIEKYLVVHNFKDIDRTISGFTEDKRLAIIEQIKESDDWKRVKSVKFLKKKWKGVI